jgi:preprotein translocase subunit SecD
VCGNIPPLDADADPEVAASYVTNLIPDCVEDSSTGTTSTTAPGSTTTAATTTPTTTPGTTPPDGDAAGERRIDAAPIAAVVPAQETSSTTASTAPASTTTAASGTTTTTVAPTTTTAPGAPLPGSGVPTTPPEDDTPNAIVVLPERLPDDAPDDAEPGRYILAPTVLTGEAISSAEAQFQPTQGVPAGEWTVVVDFDGNQFVDEVAEPYVNQPIAIVLDGVVISAPTINPGITGSDPVLITGNFDEGDARGLARVLKYGALPVQFDPAEQTVRSISPTLGEDQLQAGIVAGIIGLALVALYMIAFYRILGLVVVAGLVLTGMIFFSLVAFLSESQGLTLTLAGVTGLIVSVGVTVDSYVVYFERLKDEVRSGKTVRSSVTAGFRKSFRTILTADLVALIGAAILWALAEGSVRGFAFFLGLSTVIDLVIAYFFMHPLVAIMAQRGALVRLPRVGIAAGLDVAGAER